jgi:hypothetical protein
MNILGIQGQYYILGYIGKKIKVTKSTYLLWQAYKLGKEDRKKKLPCKVLPVGSLSWAKDKIEMIQKEFEK